ncbi:MAG: pyruvate, phosphate dikinase [Rickettsiaceae bacterium]|nr:pyruvate, phosphate dikinase [Rickettsiaceae bacterium]
MTQLIYHFGQDNFSENKVNDKVTGKADGNAGMTAILGGKGANLAEMSNIGLPIPAGFTISTDICQQYYENNNVLPEKLLSNLDKSISKLEQATGKVFGGKKNPLLLSVRSGAKISMPGMMDTILNLGINDKVAETLAKETNNAYFAYDSYRRFLQMFGSVVLEIPTYCFEEKYEQLKLQHNFIEDSEVTPEVLQEIISEFKNIITKKTKKDIVTDPRSQLHMAIEAVIKSWMSPRAVIYRKINNITDIKGTAVNIQAMVFGNKGELSATGVIFTRSPVDGEKHIFGEYLINAQGEDVVAGIRTPANIATKGNNDSSSLQHKMPKLYDEIINVCHKLESHYGDMQDIEFTIEEGKLYILQTRKAKRAAAASVKVAVDMVSEGNLTKEQALMHIDPESLNYLLHTTVDYSDKPKIIATGLPASPGAATGIVVFSPHEAEELSHHHKVILVRNETSPEDIKGMHVSAGIMTAKGGMTSHAAVVTRGMGKPCVCGVKGLTVNENERCFITETGQKINHGETITIDGSTGNIIVGEVMLVEPKFSQEFITILSWADEIRNLKVRANAETKQDANIAMKFGAEGIGLCRTEHMFFDDNKIPFVRQMIIAQDYEQRMQAINKLKPLQVQDFKALFKILNGKPINIRLLDPPLHEFLPTNEADIESLAKELGLLKPVIDYRLNSLHELNPMLGHRGCRLGVTSPEIYIMQIEAIFTAIHQLYDEDKIKTNLELMIPLISDAKELEKIKEFFDEKKAELGSNYAVKFGTMIELPRAALMADKIAGLVDYFSFGTNDLTQTTYGISRDDTGSFMHDYIEKKIFPADPFHKIDTEGVGELIEIAIRRGKKIKADLTLGVCGEHAGDPSSINFFQKLNFDYISCSPHRVPIARIAAAQSKIKLKQENKLKEKQS